MRPASNEKRPVNLSINARTLDLAKEMGMNLFKTVDAYLQEEVKRRYWEKWRDDNKEAFAAYNERIRTEGLPLAKYRTFGRSLGDGREHDPQE
jgi:antitoxin CcdA